MTDRINWLQRNLDVTNADHVALWLEANTIPEEPMNQCAGWLACRIVEAHEAALAAATRRAKTPKAVECEASQSGPKGNAQ